MRIFLLWILFIALEITDPFSLQTLDKYFNLHILVFMLIFKCISLIWIRCRLSADASGTPVFCLAPSKPVWDQCWAMNSRVHPLLGAWLSLSLTYIRLVVGLTLDFPHLYCLPLDGGNLAFVSQRCFLFLWPGHAKSLPSVLDLWTLSARKVGTQHWSAVIHPRAELLPIALLRGPTHPSCHSLTGCCLWPGLASTCKPLLSP